MDQRAPLPEIRRTPERGDVLVIAPHADDEVIGVGGTLSLHAAQGDRVHVIIVFDGSSSDVRGRVREREARAGGERLGIHSYEFWNLAENHVPTERELELGIKKLARRISQLEPLTLYAPWVGEHHLDHHHTALATRAALDRLSTLPLAWGYEVWTPLVPTRIVDVTRTIERKRAALEEHATQLRGRDLVHAALGLAAQRSLYLPPPARFGEAFAPLCAVDARLDSLAARAGAAMGYEAA